MDQIVNHFEIIFRFAFVCIFRNCQSIRFGTTLKMTFSSQNAQASEHQNQFELFKAIVDNLPTSVFVKDENLRMLYLNKACLKRVGLPADEVIGKSDEDLFSPDKAFEFMTRDRAVMAGGGVNYTEEETHDRDGVVRVWGTTKTRFEGPNGQAYLLGGQFDVTNEHRRKAQYSTLTETAPVGICRFDDQGKSHFTNDLFLGYIGLSREDIDTTDLQTCFPSADRKLLGLKGEFESHLISKTGVSRHVLVISSGFEQTPGEAHSAATVCVFDLSAMKDLQRINDEVSRLNSELAKSLDNLKLAQDEIIRNGRMTQLGALTATIAHELRNPLGAVRTSAFLIKRQLKDDNPKLVTQLQRIETGVVRCDSIITQLLDFARNKKPSLSAVILDRWLEDVVSEEIGKVKADVACTLDLATYDTQVLFDPSQMSRVVINLLSNAVEALQVSETKHNAHIIIRSRLRDGLVELEVQDNGPGISPENIQKIMEPLFTTKNFGTGLGLPAVQKILELHGGALNVTSVEGEGARFTASWPAKVETTDQIKVA
jgi:PAS domain S-box-containing protein